MRWNSIVSPWRTRINFPGTFPPKVQNVYSTPSEMGKFTSLTSSSTMSVAGALRVTGGGTCGASVVTALSAALEEEPAVDEAGEAGTTSQKTKAHTRNRGMLPRAEQGIETIRVRTS